MASPRQIEANRQNARRSTGPRTGEGKAASRGNALKHGLAGETAAMSASATEMRREAWGRPYRIETEVAAFALDRLVAASLRIERCEQEMEGITASEPERARLAWDADRHAECAAIFGRIGRSPGVVVARLKGSLHGVDLLLTTWNRLGESLADGGAWTEAEEALALDLLGIPPACREGRTAIDGPNGGDLDAFRRALVVEAVAKLEATVEELGELDLLDRKLAIAGVSTLSTPKARLLLRYEREAWRRYREARRILEPLKIPAEERVAPKVTPAPAPAPRVGSKPIATGRPAEVANAGPPRDGTKPIPPALASLEAGHPWANIDANASVPLDFAVGRPPRRP